MEGQVKTLVTEKNSWMFTHTLINGRLRWKVEGKEKGEDEWFLVRTYGKWKTAIDRVVALESEELEL